MPPRKRGRGGGDSNAKKPPGEFNVMNWWLNSRDGVDAAQDRDVARSCSSKDAYRTEEEARAHAAMNGMSGALFTYRCTYCDSWHLTRRKPFEGNVRE